MKAFICRGSMKSGTNPGTCFFELNNNIVNLQCDILKTLPMEYDVFISSKSEDYIYAEEIYDFLRLLSAYSQ